MSKEDEILLELKQINANLNRLISVISSQNTDISGRVGSGEVENRIAAIKKEIDSRLSSQTKIKRNK